MYGQGQPLYLLSFAFLGHRYSTNLINLLRNPQLQLEKPINLSVFRKIESNVWLNTGGGVLATEGRTELVFSLNGEILIRDTEDGVITLIRGPQATLTLGAEFVPG